MSIYKIAVVLAIILLIFGFTNIENLSNGTSANSYNYIPNYNGTKAVEYGLMVHNDYLHKAYYPSGLNQSVLQKNLDYFNSEDCAHFVSEALIAGGLKYLAQIPPGDNLTHYLSGFNGSYGIVGVYRLADWLAGYVIPIISTNQTIEGIIGYQPIPASYLGSPHASIFYVVNDTILPSYILWPGDVVMDGGAGDGHAMLYIGNDDVVQTDPAMIWNYTPGYDANITTTIYISSPNGTLKQENVLSLNGENVSSIYVHIPTFPFNSKPLERITLLQNGVNVTNGKIDFNKTITFVASFPEGIGFGNYTYEWLINGKEVSSNQIFSIKLSKGSYKIELEVTGSNGTETAYYYIGSPVKSEQSFNFYFIIAGIVIIIAVAIFLLKRKK